MSAVDTVSSAVAKPARPGWTGFRWGAGAGGLYALLVGAGLGFFATVWDSGADATLSEALPTLAIFLLPSFFGGLIFGGIGGAITMKVAYWLLGRMESVSRGKALLVTLGVCLGFMLLIAMPVLALLYSDGNFWRGLEESLIVGIPFYFLPGIFYVVAMVLAVGLNYGGWFGGLRNPSTPED